MSATDPKRTIPSPQLDPQWAGPALAEAWCMETLTDPAPRRSSLPSRSPPAQKALPLTDWPQADRKAWTDAQVRADVLDDGGIVSHLSPCTLQDLTRRYAYFLYFLAEEAKLNPHGPAAASVTEERSEEGRV